MRKPQTAAVKPLINLLQLINYYCLKFQYLTLFKLKLNLCFAKFCFESYFVNQITQF